MYLSQGSSAFVFTIIRLILQASLLSLISNLASRTRNLTYQERINGGFVSGIKYLFFTKFSPRRQHFLGRFYVALTLGLTLTLNYLPTYLNNLYPVLPTHLPTNLKELDISTEFAKTTALSPNKTSVEDILFNMGVSLNGSIFDHYAAPPADRLSCAIDQFGMDCSGERFRMGGLKYRNISLAAGTFGRPSEIPRPQNGSTLDGERFEYYNTTDHAGTFRLTEMFVEAGGAVTNVSADTGLSSPRSLESCLTKHYPDHRCVRHSLGYLLSESKHIFVISRRVYTMTFFRALNITAWKTMPDFIDPSINTTLDCSRLPTLTFKTMCTQINSLGAPPTYGIYSMQNMSVDSNERIHWDIITTRLEALNNKSVVLNLEAFHLDVGAELYNSQIDIGKATRALNSSSLSLTQFSGRETFEATYFVPMKEVSLYDHAWINWGFSQEDIGNMTKFLIGGTLLNSGVLMMQSPELLANISDIAVILLVGTSVVIAVLGWFVSRGVDSTVRDPITEVLPKVLDYKQRRKPKETTFPSLRYLRVANLTLVPAQISDPPALSCSPKATTDLSSSITIDSDTGPSSSITIIAESPLPPSIKDANYGHDCSSAAKSSKADILVLRMDIDGDDEQIEVINVLETTEQDRSRTLSNTLGQSQTNSAVALLPLARQQSSASLRLS